MQINVIHKMFHMILILKLMSLQLVKNGYTQKQIYLFVRYQAMIFAMLIEKERKVVKLHYMSIIIMIIKHLIIFHL